MSNSKNDTTEKKIIEQVEFYFSDSNLPKDKFLRTIVANHPEGYVPIDTIASFQRMQRLSTDRKFIVDSLKKSKMLQIDDAEKLIRRITPLPEVNNAEERTINVNGLPLDSTLDSVKEKFEVFGKVNCIRMRKNREKEFSGYASIEFNKKEDLEKFLYINKVHVITKEEEEKRRLESKENGKQGNKSSEYSKEKMKAKIQETKQKYEFESGSILNITNIGQKEEIRRDNLREVFEKFGDIKFIDYPYGLDENNTRGVIRFAKQESVKKIMDDYNSSPEAKEKYQFGGSDKSNPTKLEPLKKEDEEEYFEIVVKTARERKNIKGRGKRGYGGKHYGGNKKKRRM